MLLPPWCSTPGVSSLSGSPASGRHLKRGFFFHTRRGGCMLPAPGCSSFQAFLGRPSTTCASNEKPLSDYSPGGASFAKETILRTARLLSRNMETPMLRKLSLICAVVAVLFVPTTPTFAGHGHGGHGHGGHGHGGHGHGVAVMGTGMVVMVTGVVDTGAAMDGAVGGVQASAWYRRRHYGRRCWDPYYGYYPCRYRWGY